MTSDENGHTNLSTDEWRALKELKEDKDIIIKEADKGGAFVIMDHEFYKDRITSMLNNGDTYKRVGRDKEEETKRKLDKFIKKYSKSLTKEEQKYITDFDMKTSNIYGLPKIHKSQQIKDAVKEQNSTYIQLKDVTDLKFRPIIAGPICPTSHLSALLDELLKPFLQHVHS